MTITDILDKATSILQGEPLRAITYGSAVIIYFAARALGAIPDQSFDQAIVSATAATAVLITVVESARRFVSPASKVEDVPAQVEVGNEP